MSNPISLKVSAQCSLAVAGLLLLPALWSLGSAIWSAATTGQVLVISIGRYETARSMVPWPEGWARFVGPLVLASSLFVWLASKSGERVAVWWSSAALAVIGMALLMYSRWFTSWGGSFGFVTLVALIATALYIGNRFGRLAAVGFVLLVFAVIVWRVDRGSWL